ncbi:hypothetical protein OK016_13230 [Vibrio chagasii]|nr:hypothetical protein [Vibrio chagasii]
MSFSGDAVLRACGGRTTSPVFEALVYAVMPLMVCSFHDLLSRSARMQLGQPLRLAAAPTLSLAGYLKTR